MVIIVNIPIIIFRFSQRILKLIYESALWVEKHPRKNDVWQICRLWMAHSLDTAHIYLYESPKITHNFLLQTMCMCVWQWARKIDCTWTTFNVTGRTLFCMWEISFRSECYTALWVEKNQQQQQPNTNIKNTEILHTNPLSYSYTIFIRAISFSLSARSLCF